MPVCGRGGGSRVPSEETGEGEGRKDLYDLRSQVKVLCRDMSEFVHP